MKPIGSLLAALGLVVSAQFALAETWDLPTYVPEKSFHAENLRLFAEDVKAATGGELEIAVHTSGSLVKEDEVRAAVRSGVVPIGAVLLSSLGNENPVFNLDAIPFVASSYDESRALWNASRDKVNEILGRQGLVALYAVPWNPQALFSVKPLETAEDLKGVKFRSYNKMTARLAELIGATPVQVSIGDVATAFTTGRVDVMITSPVTGANRTAWDYSDYFYHTQAGLPKEAVIINRKVFDRLDEDVRAALLDAAAQAEDRGWRLSEEDTEKNGLEPLVAHGMKGVEPSPALMEGLKAAGNKMVGEWLEQTGDDGRAIIDAYAKR